MAGAHRLELWTHNAAASVSGLITVDSGTVKLGAANVFAGDAAGVLLDDTRSTPAAAAWKSRPITRTANTYTGGTIVVAVLPPLAFGVKLAAITRGRTALIIAHRLAAVRHCHRIVGVADGRIVETGTHDELLARPGGLYAYLWRLQTEGGPQPHAA